MVTPTSEALSHPVQLPLAKGDNQAPGVRNFKNVKLGI